MTKLQTLRKKSADQALEARKLLDKADATAEDKASAAKLIKEIEDRKAEIETEERLGAFEAEQARLNEQRGGRPDPADGGGVTRASVVTQGEVRCAVYKRTQLPDGKFREAYEEGRAINPKQEFRTLGEQLIAVRNAEKRGGIVDPRLLSVNRKAEEEERAASGMSESVGADGGFAVQSEFASELAQRTYSTGEILTRVNATPVGPSANGLKVNMINETSRANGSRWGGIQVYRTGEAAALTGSAPKLRLMELTLKKLTGLLYATDELMQDAVALEGVIQDAFPKEMSFKMEDEIINGTGAGAMQGILNANALLSISKETGQLAATIVKENIDNMWARMWAPSRANAVWLINQDTEPQLDAMQLVIGTGGVPVYLPPGGLSETPFSRLKGRTVIPVEYCATLGTVGDILLVDLSQYRMISKGGLQATSSIHVRFLNDEMTFRFIIRNDAQPAWASALTPFKGSATLSPYVALATRA